MTQPCDQYEAMLTAAEASWLREDEHQFFALDGFLSHDQARNWLRRLARERIRAARYRDILESLAAYLDGASPEAWTAADVRAVLDAIATEDQ